MTIDHRERLARIRRFDQLVAYLRDELGWPINSDDFEELTFDYTPEELGIDAKNAAKIQEIKRLRPLIANQPWGIFFVKFEPKRLPVVALRRILGQVALKKRASANRAERQAWAADDLLFISSYGEAGDDRCIAFAHFSKAKDGEDLPTLKVLGWDNLDTPLHLDAVARELTGHLTWPDEEDADAWCEQWRAAFMLRHREVITTSRELSIRLAELARAIRDRIKTAVAIETENGPLTKLMRAFQTALVHDLDADAFADMYAQTIGYGLLSARIADPRRKTADDFADHMRTNPFLRELMETFLKVGGRRGRAGGPGIDFDELGVSEVVELLDYANMEAVVRDFGDRNPQDDPVIHFYELFLKEYDAKKRMQRGVFYTPRPVVSYIVRSVDELLRTDFGLADGLADTTTWGEMAKRHKGLKIPEGVSPDQDFVQILDPATGTGTFLVEIIDLIHETLVARWKRQGHGERKIDALWNEYVPKHLLTRLHGYELLMAPYAIAHLKIGLKLYETGYRFGSDERARVFLTNALEPAQDFSGRFEFSIPALAHEAQAVNGIKSGRRFTAVVGNPPYSKLSSNRNEWIDGLLHGRVGNAGTANYYECDGAPLGERTLWIQDDYIKFMRLSQLQIDRTGVGIHAFITNNGYLDNPTLRGMRQQLKLTFERLRVLDLHGSTKRGDTASDGAADKNVFDIQQGVAIGVFTRRRADGQAKVLHAGLWGDRESKYRTLGAQGSSGIGYVEVASKGPAHLFIPIDATHQAEYESAQRVTEVFTVHHSGIITKRDSLAIHRSADEAFRTVSEFAALSPKAAKEKFGLPDDVRDWKVTWAQADLREAGISRSKVIPVLYRPFDVRFTYFTGRSRGFVGWPVANVTRLMLSGSNLALVTTRMTKGEAFDHVLVSRQMIEVICLSAKTSNNAFIFPLYSNSSGTDDGLFSRTDGSTLAPNISPGFTSRLASLLGIPFESQLREPSAEAFGPVDVFNYAVALLSSQNYRKRYSEFLSRDFPRILVPATSRLFRALARLGDELVALYLLESPKLDHTITEYVGSRAPEVEKVSWSRSTVWLDKAETTGFKGVREEVWNFHIGGYQVCAKWLKDRKSRALSKDDIKHYQRIVVALSESIRLMREIDDVIEQHGGWPDAFQTGASETAERQPLLKVAEPQASYGTGKGSDEK